MAIPLRNPVAHDRLPQRNDLRCPAALQARRGAHAHLWQSFPLRRQRAQPLRLIPIIVCQQICGIAIFPISSGKLSRGASKSRTGDSTNAGSFAFLWRTKNNRSITGAAGNCSPPQTWPSRNQSSRSDKEQEATSNSGDIAAHISNLKIDVRPKFGAVSRV